MARSSRFTAATTPTYIERTDLPRISVQSHGGVRYAASVQSYVSGSAAMLKGAKTTALLSLSLLAMRGHGAVLRGLWSALIANHLEDITIDGLDRVALAHHVLPGMRYQLHWNYRQETLDTGELHATIESHMLTLCDPVRAVAGKERPPRRQVSSRRKPRGGKVETTTMKKKDEMDEKEATLRHLFPLFLLRVPGSSQPQRLPEESTEAYAQRCQQALVTWRTHQHFAFLDPRYPWPLLPEWKAFLWQRGVAQGEITPLKVWSPQVVQDEERPRTLPLWSEAWLCRPDPRQIKRDLDRAHTRGDLPLPAWLNQQEAVRELVGSVS